MRLILALTSLALLAACGADGPPIRPTAKAEAPSGLTVSGGARIGMIYRG